MKERKAKKAISIFLCLLIILTTFPVMGLSVFAEDTISDEMSAKHIEHDTPFTYTEGEVPAGSYYLADDIALTGDLTITGEVDLCLNGKVFNVNGDHQIYVTGTGSALNLYDCQETVHKFTTSEDGRYWVLDEKNGDIEVVGGVITGGYLESADKWTSLMSITNGALNIYKANIVGNAFYYTGEKDYNHLVYMKDGVFNIYSGTVSGNVSINVDGETPSGPALFYIFRSTSFIGKYAVFSYNLAETCPYTWMCPLIYYYKTDAEVYGEFSNNNLAQSTTDDCKIILLITTCTVNFYGKIENNNGADLFWVRLNAYANMDGTISGNNCKRAVYTERTAVTDINGMIKDNTCNYAVFCSDGGTANINAPISDNTCDYSVVHAFGETTTINLNSSITDNESIKRVINVAGGATIHITENAEITGNTSTDKVSPDAIENGINMMNISTGTPTVIFDGIPSCDIGINYCDSFDGVKTRTEGTVEVAEGVDKEALVEKLKGVQGEEDFELDDEGNIVCVAHVHETETLPSVAATCTETGLTEGVKCVKCGLILTAQEIIPALGHNRIENYHAKAATCTEEGYTGDVYCTRCETILMPGDVIPMAEHTRDNTVGAYPATHKTEGFTGKVYCHCGALVDEGSVIPKTAGEDYEHEDIETDENGHRDHKCDYCGAVLSVCIDEQDENGLKDHICDICGERISDCYDASGDHMCDVCGERVSECKDTTNNHLCDLCGEKISDHEYTLTLTQEATCTAKGQNIYTCYCGDSYSEDIEMLDHTPKTVEAVAPTCTEDGFTSYTVCADCGTVLEPGHSVYKLGHPQEYREVKGFVAATCTEAGYTGDVICTLCGETVTEGHTIDPSGHTRDDIRNAKEATHYETGYTGDVYCGRCGELVEEGIVIPKTSGEGVAHKDENGDHLCDGCGERISPCIDVVINVTGVEGKDHLCDICNEKLSECADENHNHFCDICGNRMPGDTGCYDSEGDGNHRCDYCGVMMEGYVCADNTNDHYCDECGAKISAHSYVYSYTVPATCTNGEYNVYECEICREVYNGAQSTPTAHAYAETEKADATCTENGYIVYTCADCGAEYTSVIHAKGHTPGATVIENEVPATCTTKGSYNEVVKCADCGATVTVRQKTTALVAHDYEETERVAVSCEKNGYILYTCADCGGTRKEIIKTTGHEYEVAQVIAPTCTEKGHTVYVCTVCGDEYNSDFKAAKGHKDSDNDGVCDACGIDMTNKAPRCSMCEIAELNPPTTFAGFFINIIHKIVHFFATLGK